MAKNLSILEKIISYYFKDKTLLKLAVTHKSFKKLESNENLEFLGDRVLGLVISEKLLIDKPGKQEGSLDKMLSSLVDRNACHEIAKKISLGDFILLGQTEKSSRGNNKKSILSDACEALLGAIYLDSSFPKYKIISKTGPDHNPKFKIQVEFMNYKKAIGTSSSIKESEKNAALAFIEKNKINSIK